MPEDEENRLIAKIDAQTLHFDEGFRTLSGEIKVNRGMIRDSLARVSSLEVTVDGVDGDSERPGIAKRQRADDKVRDRAAWTWRITAGFLAIALPVTGYLASGWIDGYAERGRALADHGTQLVIHKARIDHMESETEARQQAILDALGER